jgi:hypothetical protein
VEETERGVEETACDEEGDVCVTFGCAETVTVSEAGEEVEATGRAELTVVRGAVALVVAVGGEVNVPLSLSAVLLARDVESCEATLS